MDLKKKNLVIQLTEIFFERPEDLVQSSKTLVDSTKMFV